MGRLRWIETASVNLPFDARALRLAAPAKADAVAGARAEAARTPTACALPASSRGRRIRHDLREEHARPPTAVPTPTTKQSRDRPIHARKARAVGTPSQTAKTFFIVASRARVPQGKPGDLFFARPRGKKEADGNGLPPRRAAPSSPCDPRATRRPALPRRSGVGRGAGHRPRRKGKPRAQLPARRRRRPAGTPEKPRHGDWRPAASVFLPNRELVLSNWAA